MSASPSCVPRGPSAPVVQALGEISREAFLPGAMTTLARQAPALVTPDVLVTPSVQVAATLVEALGPAARGRVLLIGCGVGYLAAVLSRVSRELLVVDDDATLVALATRALERAGCIVAGKGVEIRCGDEAVGAPDRAPFDAVLVARSLDAPPTGLLAQLVDGGVLVVPIGTHRRMQQLLRVTRVGDRERRESLGSIPLYGRIGDLLVDLGACKRSTVEEAARVAAQHGTRIGEALGVEEAELYRSLALQHDEAFAPATALVGELDPTLARSVPRPFLEKHHVLPVKREDGTLTLATSDPETDLGDLARAFPSQAFDVRVVTPTDYRRLWSVLDLQSTKVTPLAKSPTRSEDLLDREGTMSAHAVALFEALLLDAIGERASDVHLERYNDEVRVRLRVDGDLHDRPRFQLTPDDLRKVVNVVKVSADLDISEQRLPQGGRFRRRAGGQTFDLRVQTQPSLYGEHVVIRLLSQESKLLTIEDLGFPAPVAREYRRLLDSPAGLILVVGPTGSGKSTTLYAGLQVLARDPTRKVISIEDPIEYSVPGVQQTQARPDLGFKFADAMRAFVREDPDVILVGEIRDHETALEAIRASQTGHIVLSTLHCNDATDAVQRLVDLDMHPNSIGSELLAVVAQRLAKRTCDACRVEVAPDPEVVAELFPDGAPPGLVSVAGRGCPRCGGHGTHGRIAIIEYLRVGADVRRAVSRGLSLDDLRRVAHDSGLVTMRKSALELVQRGVVSLAELRWVLSAERMAPERPERPWD